MTQDKEAKRQKKSGILAEKIYQSLDQYFYERNGQIQFAGALMIIMCSLFWLIFDSLNGHVMKLNTPLSMTGLLLMMFSSAHIMLSRVLVKKIKNYEKRLLYYRISYLLHYLIMMFGVSVLCIINNRLLENGGVLTLNYSVPLSAFFLCLIIAAPLPKKEDAFLLGCMGIFSIIFPLLTDGRKAYNLPAHIVLYLCMFVLYGFFYRRNAEGYYTHRSLIDHRISLSRANVITSLFLETYDAVYYVDMKRDYFEIYRASALVREKYRTHSSFKRFVTDYIENEVLESDRAMLTHLLDYDYIREQIRLGKRLLVAQYNDMSTGSPRYTEIMIVSAPDGAETERIAISVTDRDEAYRTELARKRQLQQAIDVANQDPLTHVKSRAAFSAMQKQSDILIAAKQQEPFAVAVCDINGLKEANDRYGHEVGDNLIIACSKTICAMFAHSPVFRIGGDEFTVILTGRDYENREKILQKISSYLRSEDAIAENISFATGISAYDPQTDSDFQSVFVRADALMYEQKREMKNGRSIR